MRMYLRMYFFRWIFSVSVSHEIMHFCFYSFLIHFCFLILWSPHAHEMKRWNDAARHTSPNVCHIMYSYFTTRLQLHDIHYKQIQRFLSTFAFQRTECSREIYSKWQSACLFMFNAINSEFLLRNKHPGLQFHKKESH